MVSRSSIKHTLTPKRHLFCGSLILPALLLLIAPQAARAQERPVSLDVVNAPLQTVLVSLFKSAGVRNFVVDAAVGGRVTATLTDVPLTLALRQLLNASQTPLMFDAEQGVYHVRLRPVVSPLPSAPAPSPGEVFQPAGNAVRFTEIGVRHYDAAVMADLATRPGGIIVVPPNFVMPFGASAGMGRTGPGSGPAPNAVSQAGANNVLPDGVKRIYAREGDNVLVVEATPQGLADLPL